MKVSISGVYTGETELAPLEGDKVPTVAVHLRLAVLERLAKTMPARIREAARQSDTDYERELEAEQADLERKITLLRAIHTKNDTAAYGRYINYLSEANA